jgi:hypothetical protein
MMRSAAGGDHRKKGVAVVGTQLSEPHSMAAVERSVDWAEWGRYAKMVASLKVDHASCVRAQLQRDRA